MVEKCCRTCKIFSGTFYCKNPNLQTFDFIKGTSKERLCEFVINNCRMKFWEEKPKTIWEKLIDFLG